MSLTNQRQNKGIILGIIFGLVLGIPLGISVTETFPYKTWRWGQDKATQINDCKRLLPTWVQERLPKNK